MLQESDGEIPGSPTKSAAFIQQCCRIATIPGRVDACSRLWVIFHGEAAQQSEGMLTANLPGERGR
jgi:hypothetical protein